MAKLPPCALPCQYHSTLDSQTGVCVDLRLVLDRISIPTLLVLRYNINALQHPFEWFDGRLQTQRNLPAAIPCGFTCVLSAFAVRPIDC